MIFRAARSALHRRGIEIRRRPLTMHELCSAPRAPSAGQILEFIGTEGSGKTTLNNALTGHFRKNWYLRSDIEGFGPAPERSPALEDLHRDIFLRYFDTVLDGGNSSWFIISRARQKSFVVAESLTISTHPISRGFVLDEGLFKTFPEEVLALAADDPAPLWRSRAFVYVKLSSPEVAVDRLLGRTHERKARGMPLEVPARDEVRARIEHQVRLFDTMAEKAVAFGRPLLTIDADAPQAENHKKIIDFEASLLAAHPKA